MTDAPDRMRLTVLGGYLGSGKTTWLRHQLHTHAFGRVHVIVNEAAETPVDDALLGAAEGMTVLAGGPVDTTGQQELIDTLRALCDARSKIASDGPRLQQIVLETSGLADPGPIVAAVRHDPMLVHHITVDRIIVAVDALHSLAQLATEPLGRRQIEAADELVVTKVDAAPLPALAQLVATLRVLNPTAPITAAVRGEAVPMPDLPAAEPAPLPQIAGESAPILPTRLHLGDDIDWTAFTVWLSALLHARGNDLVRVKGVVRTPAGRLLLQTVRKVVQQPEILPEQTGDPREDDTIVFIGRGYRSEDLERSLHHFAGRKIHTERGA